MKENILEKFKTKCMVCGDKNIKIVLFDKIPLCESCTNEMHKQISCIRSK